MAGARRRIALERLLSVVTHVREGEAGTALILTLNVFLVLMAYYVIKPVREALILAVPGGPQYKSYAAAGVAVLLLAAVPLYARMAGRLPRNRLVIGVTLFFAGCLVLFYVLGVHAGLAERLGIVFYLWVGVFNLMIVAQFWAFANDLYDVEQGERLFALIGLGASLGAVVGSKTASWLATPLGVYDLLLVSALILLLTAGLTQWSHVRESRRPRPPPAQGNGRRRAPPPPAAARSARHLVRSLRRDESVPIQQERRGIRPRNGAARQRPQPRPAPPAGGFSLVLKHRYLLLLAVFSLLFTMVNSNGEYILSRVVASAAPVDAESGGEMGRELWVTRYYGSFYFQVNLIGLLLQGFVVSRLVRRGGVSLPFFLMPVLALGSAVMMFLFPMLAVVSVAKKLENATDYSVHNTVRHMLWLPTSTEMKYKAKQAVDAFFVRMGDVGSAALVFTGTVLASLPVRGFALLNAVLVAAWLVVGTQIMRERQRLELRARPPRR